MNGGEHEGYNRYKLCQPPWKLLECLAPSILLAARFISSWTPLRPILGGGCIAETFIYTRPFKGTGASLSPSAFAPPSHESWLSQPHDARGIWPRLGSLLEVEQDGLRATARVMDAMSNARKEEEEVV